MIKMEGVQENQGKQGINLEQAMNALIDYEWNRTNNKPGINELTSRIQHIIRLIKESSDFYRSTGGIPRLEPITLAREVYYLEKLIKESDVPLQLEPLREKIVNLYEVAHGGNFIEKKEKELLKKAIEDARKGNRVGIEDSIGDIEILRYLKGRTFPEEEDKKTLEEIWDVYNKEGIPYRFDEEIEKAEKELRRGNIRGEIFWLSKAKKTLEEINKTIPKGVEEEMNQLIKNVDIYRESLALKQAIREAEKLNYTEMKIKLGEAELIANDRGKPLPNKVKDRINRIYKKYERIALKGWTGRI